MWTFHTAQVTLGLELETHQRRKPTATRSMERLSSGHLCQLIVNMIVIFVFVIVNTIVIFVIVMINMIVIFVIVIVNTIVIFLMLARNVMNHMSHHFNLFEATHFVLSGTSAGGFGVRSDNCDDEPEYYICIAITITVVLIATITITIPGWTQLR